MTSLPSTERRKAIHKQLEAARCLSEALFQHTKVDDLIARALAIALEVIGAEAGSVLLADPATKQLVFHHTLPRILADEQRLYGVGTTFHLRFPIHH